jgi:hypothetical protein
MNYSSIPEFNKDFAKLKKKFRTLDDDFKILKGSHIELLHVHKIQTDDPVKIENFCSASYESYKVKKFACKALKNKGVRSGLRVIYVFEPQLEKITFIEIYFKADKEVENKERLKSFLQENLTTTPAPLSPPQATLHPPRMRHS